MECQGCADLAALASTLITRYLPNVEIHGK